MVVHSDGEGALGGLLANDIFLQEVENFPGLGQFETSQVRDFRKLFLNDFIAELNAFVAYIDTGPGNKLPHLLLALSAERTLQQIRALANPSHM
jgi:hypothetical protein